MNNVKIKNKVYTYCQNMKKRKSTQKSQRWKITKIHLLFFILFVIIGVGYSITRVSDVQGFATFEISVLTPRNEVARQQPLDFGIYISNNTSQTESTGVQYDFRKLRLEGIDAGQAGEIITEQAGDEGNLRKIIIRTNQTGVSADRRLYATVHFTVIDATDEKNENGLGFAEVCTLFNPGSSNSGNLTPPVVSQNPTSGQADPTLRPTSATALPSPTPIPAGHLDSTQLCMPIEVNGSPADKMDIVFLPYLYQKDQYPRYLTDAQRAINQLKGTNISQYHSEVLSKMNWYVLNPSHERIPAEFRDKEITTEDEYRKFIDAVKPLCPHDRIIILTNLPWLVMPGGGLAGGVTQLYDEAEIPVGVLYKETNNAFAHEWGHLTAGLLDDYYTGTWFSGGYSTTGFNCTLTGSDLNPQGDPCPDGNCGSRVNDPSYQKACPQWDCTKKDCNALERELFAGAGCYPRCSSDRAFRAAPVSVMDMMIPPSVEPDVLKFNGPSLYSIIQYTFGNYR